MSLGPTARIGAGVDPPGGFVRGVGDFFKRLFGYRNRMADAASLGVHKATETLGLLAEYVTPIDTGKLADSQAILYEGQGFNTVGHIQYTDPKAAAVHEDLSFRHGEVYNQHYATEIAMGITHARRPQEQAKFLEAPLRDNQAMLQKIIADEIAKVKT
jgi:hypothetical protein